MPANLSVFDLASMRARREGYYAFARQNMARIFKPDGSYQPETENDGRIPYWIYAALVTSPNPAERDFANVIYAGASMWNEWNVFTTSSVAGHLARHRELMTPELALRSEEHLAKFVVRDEGRSPCSGANDYNFQGYNDNMPAMSVRAMILGGDILGRKDYTDQGLFFLESLCAHFDRRGLLSEYTSGTYLPVTLGSMLDVAECSINREAREMALACAHRILIDLLGHWHPGLGAMGGAQSRANIVDLTQTLSIVNALMWYLSGHKLCVNPIEALGQKEYGGPIHHGRNFGFNLAQFCEVLSPNFDGIIPGMRDWANRPRSYPYEIYGATDSGQDIPSGGVKEIQTRAFHQPLYALGTASENWFAKAGDQATLHAVLARVPEPRTWKDRIPVWHKAIEGTLDQGDIEEVKGWTPAETSQVLDAGRYHILQKGGSALVLGALGSDCLDKEISQLKFSVIFGTFLHQPDEVIEKGKWHFLRFGEVYVGVRASAMVEEKRMPVSCVIKNKYLRVEVPLIEGRTVKITPEFREWCDFGYVFEIAEKEESGLFADFQQQCLGCAWEFNHGFYRNSRYQGRHGELQIIDSVAAGTVRFMAIDGQVEPRVKLAATGLDPKLAQLFPDGRRVRQRRIAYRPHYIGSPFYERREHILETDTPV